MIFVKTEAGNQVLRDRSVRLTPRQRSAFILFDGRRTVDAVLAAGMGILQEDIEQLTSLGLIAPASAPSSTPTSLPVAGQPAMAQSADLALNLAGASLADLGERISGRNPQQRYQDAYPIATRLTASLGLRGFKLNLAVESAGRYEDLVALAPKIRAAVGPEKAAPLDRALDL